MEDYKGYAAMGWAVSADGKLLFLIGKASGLSVAGFLFQMIIMLSELEFFGSCGMRVICGKVWRRSDL